MAASHNSGCRGILPCQELLLFYALRRYTIKGKLGMMSHQWSNGHRRSDASRDSSRVDFCDPTLQRTRVVWKSEE
eukprot:2347661-Amphidinium_carterae.1